jgi:outer membrane protein OmpA-like peptidoglycan-associated protein
MKKIFLMLALFSVVVMSANAQIATEKSNALDNISLGVTAGVSTPLDFNSIFPLNTNVGIKLIKDFTPCFGLEAEGIAILNGNHFNDLKTTVKATNVGLSTVFNLTNIFKGYQGSPRVFEIKTVTGLGWMHAWNTPNNFLTAKTGIDLAFNLGKKKAHSIVVTPAVYWNLNKFGDIHFDKRNSQLAVNVSYIYHFKTSNGTHNFKTYDVGAMIDEINRLNGALAECESREPQVKIVEKVVEAKPTDAVTITVDNTKWVVSFATASAKLTNEAKFILNQIGNDAIVDVTATASPDGSKAFNQKLSERRAKAVADYLTNRGVKVNSAEGKGVDATNGKTAVVTTVQ